MKILNITFNNAKGGVEQAFIDYTKVLQNRGNEVFCAVAPNAKFVPELKKVAKNIFYIKFLRTNIFKFFLHYELKCLIKKIAPDVIIFHNERNFDVLKKAAGKTPVSVVNHGCKTTKMLKADYIFAVNTKIAEELTKKGFAPENICIIGNMIEV
jgi:hypothetical protein